MKDLNTKPGDTRDLLGRIDAALTEDLDMRLQWKLEASVFPHVEDGNGGGWCSIEERPDRVYFSPHSPGCQNKHGKFVCLDESALKNPPTGDPFDNAVWNTNYFFNAGRNDDDEPGLDYEYRIVNTHDCDGDHTCGEDEWGDRDPPE